jgi:phage terminase large subunit-like protein
VRTMPCELHPHVLRWIQMVENNEIETCEDQKLLVAYVRKCFETEDIYTDDDLLSKYIRLTEYFPFERLFEWEAFCIALHLCTFWRSDDRPRWPDLLLLIGRGAGKDGFIAVESLCLASPYSNLPRYDVDICANAEEQAMRPVNDLLEIMEDTRYTTKLKRHFYWTKEKIVGIRTKATIKGRTNNPKSKDGMRSGIVVFNEIHQYQNYANIKVFVTSLGKKKHPRRLYATTNGEVRDGPLDDLLARSEQILKGGIGDNGLLPFICRLDDKEEAKDKTKWVKANPSIPYLPDLREEIEKEFADWLLRPEANTDFMTKRMNLPQNAVDVAVTAWENIAATNRPIPDLAGKPCVAGIDYATVTDLVSANLHFREGDTRYDINHSWLCLKSKDLHRLKIPWREWAQAGHITLIDDVEVHPDIVCEWLLKQGQRYNILKLALDNYRYTLMTKSLRGIGFDANEAKNVKLVRPSDVTAIVPVIDSVFAKQCFVWGDNPVLRWATNNAKLVPWGRNVGGNIGNYLYGKIEPKSRKTDPFMALVQAMTIETELETGVSKFDDVPVITC